MNPKMLGAIQLIGAVLAVIFGFLDYTFFAIILLALVLIVTGIHHFTEEHAAEM